MIKIDQPYKTKGDVHYFPQGTSGTDISGGMFFEEYLDKLIGVPGADIYDEMRRSDDQIKMLLKIVKNPILSASWFISPASSDDTDQEIADFVNFLLFEDMGERNNPKTFEKFKREALTCLDFGYSLFEITNKVVFDHPRWGSYIGLKGIDWRSPRTIEEWHVDQTGRLHSIRQIDNSENGGDFTIDGRFLLHFSPEMEGDNYEGLSVLRNIYGNWLRKDMLRKLNMIGIERAATGVPTGTVPTGQENSKSQTFLENSLQAFVSHQKQFIIHPEGYELGSVKIDHDAEKVQKAIDAENIGMTKAFLANFMELGLNGSGSFALGSDLSDIFLSGIELYVQTVTTEVNRKLIPKLVKAKFGVREKYPTMTVEGINDKAGKEFAEVIKLLKESDVIQIDDRLKALIHKKYDLQEFLPGEANADVEEIVEEETETLEMDEKGVLALTEPNLSLTIKKDGDTLAAEMKTRMKERAYALKAEMLRIKKNYAKSKQMQEVNKLKVPGVNDYKRFLNEALNNTATRATSGVVKELGAQDLKLSDDQKVPSETKAVVKSEVDLLTRTQDADLQKQMFFTFTTDNDKLPSVERMDIQLTQVADEFLESPAIRTAAANAIANVTNLARNSVFQKEEVLERIESFVFTNPSPDAAICKELSGRVFTKEEYLTTDKLPPLHHNCNSWIKAQVTAKKGNRKVNPIGLAVTGTEKEIETKLKSKKF